ncbi:hypothetical protein THAOC_09312 [Thalassiosira oceanica]|uniref:Uncharacterized protein n=1 Tax=Thalassiosira oceanica TaxID=159749 RepID=K0T7W0_THAOC|nr:hypothetical protein THAOC_09312 [Thalassiosira oceanica]|eukprot:EJK69436.1 hypothetical protein THAOC_09312 [Thalassiosira oceanica]
MPLFLSTAAGDPPPSSPSSVPEAVQLHSDLLVDFASRRTVDLGGRRGPPTTAAAASGGGADGGGDASAGDDGSGSRRHSALTYQAVQTRGDGAADSGDRTGADVNRNGRPDLGVWDCRVRPSTASASAALLRRVVVDRAGPRGADGECEAAAGEGGSEDPKGR